MIDCVEFAYIRSSLFFDDRNMKDLFDERSLGVDVPLKCDIIVILPQSMLSSGPVILSPLEVIGELKSVIGGLYI